MQLSKWDFHLEENGLEKESMINFFSFFKKRSFLIFIFILACKAKSKSPSNHWIIREFISVNLISRESGFIKMELKTPQIKEFYLDSKEKIYTIFPKGIEVFFYKKDKKNKSFLKASWAKFTEKDQIYEAKGNVILKNAQGDELKTSHIFWNKKEKKIYNEVFSEIYKANGSVLRAKNGLEGSDDLKKISLKNTDGAVLLKEDIL